MMVWKGIFGMACVIWPQRLSSLEAHAIVAGIVKFRIKAAEDMVPVR